MRKIESDNPALLAVMGFRLAEESQLASEAQDSKDARKRFPAGIPFAEKAFEEFDKAVLEAAVGRTNRWVSLVTKMLLMSVPPQKGRDIYTVGVRHSLETWEDIEGFPQGYLDGLCQELAALESHQDKPPKPLFA